MNGPMQGAAATPIVSPIRKAPIAPCRPPLNRVSQPGIRISNSPNIDNAMMMKISTSVPVTQGLCSQEPKRLPVRPASTPSRE